MLRNLVLILTVSSATAFLAFAGPGPGGSGEGVFPTVSLSVRKAVAKEPGTHPTDQGAFLLRRTGDTGSSLEVHVLWGGTATGGKDYEGVAETYTIPPGSDSLAILVTPKDDQVQEGDETVTLEILAGDYKVGGAGPLTVTLVDDDSPGGSGGGGGAGGV